MAAQPTTEITGDPASSASARADAVVLDGVQRRFGEVVAVAGISLEVGDGEFFSLLGPSGSGKTTTLRMIAGFEQPDAGRVLLHGRDVSRAAPYERDVNTVFQDYALFPHMTVGENIAYGMMVSGVERAERDERTREALATVRMHDLGSRQVSELSGGQRQRVALARAVVNRPSVLLLDEPLGALDLKLRQEMQLELKDIQRQLGITFIYVTHDQEEALTMSDRLAVFNAGRIEQVGSPADVYEQPRSAFVADFVGVSNFVDAYVAQAITGVAEPFSLRPERIWVRDPAEPAHPERIAVQGVVREVIYLGVTTRYVVELADGGELLVQRQNIEHGYSDALEAHGRTVRLEWHPDYARPLT